jgi:hypothetical protein
MDGILLIFEILLILSKKLDLIKQHQDFPFAPRLPLLASPKGNGVCLPQMENRAARLQR